MDYVMVCPLCSTPCVDRFENRCSKCGITSDLIFVYAPLIKAVEILIKTGFRVTVTDIRCYTSHKLKITITLAEAVPEHLLDLPSGWQIKSYQLCCTEINPDRNSHIIYIRMINNLEKWLVNKDPDGMKAVLRLSGYDTGQENLSPFTCNICMPLSPKLTPLKTAYRF